MERSLAMASLPKEWDVIVIGGGITGASIFKEASRLGLKVLLLEQKDFSWGTSSRSGKLVHGGLRYLKQGQIKTTWESVHERERLLKEYKYLVEPLRFLFPSYKRDTSPLLLKLGLTVYDLMAKRRDHKTYDATSLHMQAPHITENNLIGGLSFSDAKTDDARLVLRIISEGEQQGGIALNYMEVKGILKVNSGRVVGVHAFDKVNGKEYELFSQTVINATGIFADNIRSKIGKAPLLRKLRGSHIIYPHWRFPVYQAISFNHPKDKRPLYVLPWQGTTLVGTTDTEHKDDINNEPKLSKEESEYLFDALDTFFPSLSLSKTDAISTFAGIRPVLNTGKSNPSKESRDYIVLSDHGLITATGGKLTTFRLLALDALKKAKKYIVSENGIRNSEQTSQMNMYGNVHNPMYQRLESIFGSIANDIYNQGELLEKGYIENTDILWAEIIWSLKNEKVVHLEDLMLRRSRLGLITENGGIHLLDRIGDYYINELGYTKEAFEKEKHNYIALWNNAYSPGLL